MNQTPKETLSWIPKVEAFQLWLAGIVGSISFVVWITSFDFISNIFKPDYIKALGLLRVYLAGCGLIITAFMGIKALIWLIKKAAELYSEYRDIKKQIDKDSSKKTTD
jgi:hypothetical protein